MEKKILTSILVLQIVTLVFLSFWFLSSANRYKSFQKNAEKYNKIKTQFEEQIKGCQEEQSKCEEQLKKYRQKEEEYNKQMEEYNRNMEINK